MVRMTSIFCHPEQSEGSDELLSVAKNTHTNPPCEGGKGDVPVALKHIRYDDSYAGLTSPWPPSKGDMQEKSARANVRTLHLFMPNQTKLFFRSEHRVPRREHDRLLFHELHDVSRNVLLFYYYTEHVVVKPFVGHDQVALVA